MAPDRILFRYDGRVNYAESIRHCHAQQAASHTALANWHAEDFTYLLSTSEEEADHQAQMQVGAADKRLLQSTNAKTHYRYAHATPVPEWGRMQVLTAALHPLAPQVRACNSGARVGDT